MEKKGVFLSLRWFRRRPSKKEGRKQHAQMQSRGLVAIESGRPVRIPIETLRSGKILDYNKEGWCSAYATRAAKIVFGLDYSRGPAWELAEKNKLVLRLAKKTGKKIERPAVNLRSISQFLVPGRIIGIFLPWSEAQKGHSERLYTHAALYLGKYKGRHWIMHNWEGPCIDALESLIGQGEFDGTIVDIIEPAK